MPTFISNSSKDLAIPITLILKTLKSTNLTKPKKGEIKANSSDRCEYDSRGDNNDDKMDDNKIGDNKIVKEKIIKNI